MVSEFRTQCEKELLSNISLNNSSCEKKLNENPCRLNFQRERPDFALQYAIVTAEGTPVSVLKRNLLKRGRGR